MALSKRQRRELRKHGILDNDVAVPQRGMKLEPIKPKTFSQQRTFDAWDAGDHLLLHGMAGTGKTFISLYLALDEIFNNPDHTFHNITIVRSVVPTRDIGFLPGKEDEKIGVYEEPYKSICNELFRRGDAYDILKIKGLVNFMCTSFIRGLTLNNTIVIVDEVNNMNFHELDSLITRIGENCRVVFCGDYRQSDLTKTQEKNGLQQFMKIIDKLSGFEHVEFTKEDIVRSKLVKEYIIAREELGLCA
jgi:phosphate starvation-inducible protein PhoH